MAEVKQLDVSPLLDEGEHVQAVLRASGRPALLVKLLAIQAWPFFHEQARFLLVATDRRWLVVETSKEQWRGDLIERGSFDRSIRVSTSWVTRFQGFDRPYTIDPTEQDAAETANAAVFR
jgi:hypothetical protein